MANEKPYAQVVALVRKNQVITDNAELGDSPPEILELVINVGENDGIALDQRFLIYELGPEIFDPESKKSLGRFEIVKGEGRVTHLMPNMSKVRSSRTKRVQNTLAIQVGSENTYRIVAVPFSEPKIGDGVRPI